MKIAECFKSLQGEGPSTGVPAVFVRASKCNLRCNGAWKCDTWDLLNTGKEYSVKTLINYLEELGTLKDLKNGVRRLILTGGEPFINSQANFFVELIKKINSSLLYLEVETNGTLIHKNLFNYMFQINCSPKLSSSGILEEFRIRPDVLTVINAHFNSNFKFVVSNLADISEVCAIINKIGIKKSKVYLMPAASSRKQLIEKLPELWNICNMYGFNLSTRLHITTFNKKKNI